MYSGTNYGTGGYGQILGGRKKVVAVSDGLSLSDNIGIVSTFKTTVTDALNLSDNILTKFSIIVSDAIDYVDSVTAKATLRVTVTDAINFVDKLFGNWWDTVKRNTTNWTEENRNTTNWTEEDRNTPKTEL